MNHDRLSQDVRDKPCAFGSRTGDLSIEPEDQPPLEAFISILIPADSSSKPARTVETTPSHHSFSVSKLSGIAFTDPIPDTIVDDFLPDREQGHFIALAG